jgi:hypothetical protein
MNISPLGLLSLFLLVSCSINASERCAEDRTWNSDYKGCWIPPDTTAGAPASAGQTSGGDAAAGRSSGGGGAGGDSSAAGASSTRPNNLGASCKKDADCTEGLAGVCLIDPNAPSDPGVCTIPNCTAADCGTDFRCCDCTTSPLLATTWKVPVCAPVPNVAKLTSAAVKCTCE